MIFFIADPHLGHNNAIKYCNRPFKNVEEMNNTIVANWNTRVGSDDIVYILGDLFFGKSLNPKEYLQNLNGKKYFIPGNHDYIWMKNIDVSNYFENVALMMEIPYDNKRTITLCHYPMMSWNGERNNSGYMIHGHIHNRTDDKYFPLICSNPNILNAGVDINDFKPVTFDELVKNNQKFKKTAVSL